jgi:hypothetical protein
VQPSDSPFVYHHTTFANIKKIQEGERGGIIAGGDTPEKRGDVFMIAVTGVQEPVELNIERMPAMEDLLAAGTDRYVEAPHKMNKYEKPFQVCINQRAAVQEGERFVQTASLAICVPGKVAYRHLISIQCLNRHTIFWSKCHGNRL